MYSDLYLAAKVAVLYLHKRNRVCLDKLGMDFDGKVKECQVNPTQTLVTAQVRFSYDYY